MQTGIWKYIFAVLFLGIAAIILGVLGSADKSMHLIACDVGQGDGTLIAYKSTQILIDAGPDSKILDCLGRHISFFDRNIEVVILTHPQLDHYGGLIEVIRRYKVENIVANALDSDAEAYWELKKEVADRGIKITNPTENTAIRYGALYIDIVHPTQKFLFRNSGLAESKSGVLGSFTSTQNPNKFSIQAILSFGEFDALFTGDIGPDIVPEIIAGGELGDVEYLKIPHHGSKNGLTKELLDVTSPELAVISVGEGNHFGHPSQEVVSMLKENGIKVLRTDEAGDVEIITDGKIWWGR